MRKRQLPRTKKTKSEKGQAVHVRACGLVLYPQYRFLGASPDGLVLDVSSQPSVGLLEVKCSCSAFSKSMSMEKACANSSFCCQLVDRKPSLRHTDAYYFQVQGQLAITGAKWWDFLCGLANAHF